MSHLNYGLSNRSAHKNAPVRFQTEKTEADESEGAGARTLDLRIKSPLLYRLSYALGMLSDRLACQD